MSAYITSSNTYLAEWNKIKKLRNVKSIVGIE